jgi:hypothetical protein
LVPDKKQVPSIFFHKRAERLKSVTIPLFHAAQVPFGIA